MHRHAESYRNNVHTTNDEMSSWGWASQRDTSDDDVTFLEILHQILDESEDCPNHIISWRNDGLSFQIHDFRRFEHYLLPVYFGDGSAYCTSNQKHEALKNYDAFLGRLQSYCFHRISIDGFRKDICRHPLFVRGKRHLALKMISHKTSFLIVPRRDSWPMPALSNSGKKPSEFQRAKESRRPRPIRASIFQLKQKLAKRKSFMRQRLISSSFSTTDRRLSFKETLLRRKRSNCGSDYLPQRLNKSQTSLDELLRDFSFPSNEFQDNSDEYEPLSVSTRCDVSLVSSDSTEPDNNISTCCDADVEPLDPICHTNDTSLHGIITAALAYI